MLSSFPTFRGSKLALLIAAIGLPTSATVTYLLWKYVYNKSWRVAERKRLNQANHECEVFQDVQSEDFHRNEKWEKCTKNPGHQTFIPIKKVTMDSLPHVYRRPEVLSLVSNIAARTVRLRVKRTSKNRPEGFVFAKHRGSAIPHVGSGWVSEVFPGQGPCKCQECDSGKIGQADSTSSTTLPKRRWWKVKIRTACHVVYDTEEALATEVEISYDDEASRFDGRMKKLRGLDVIYSNREQDLSRFWAATHDEELIQGLKDLTKERASLRESIPPAGELVQRLCVCVSHPHGMPKHVTFGEVKGHVNVGDTGDCAFVYTTDTCFGSSGGPVIIQVEETEERDSDGTCSGCVTSINPHSEAVPSQGLNKCAVGCVHVY